MENISIVVNLIKAFKKCSAPFFFIIIFLTILLCLVKRMYELGTRRVLVTGTGPLGCVPAELAMRSRAGECAAELMRAADLYNPQLEQMLAGLNSQLGANIFIRANTRRMTGDFISNPQAYGTSQDLVYS